MTVQVPRLYRILRPFTLAGERGMTDADRDRIGRIYVGKEWRALAKGGSKTWYAISDAASEQAAVDQVLAACGKAEQKCTLEAIGNFAVGGPKPAPDNGGRSEARITGR